MATFMFAYITTNAQELKNPYVDYQTPPTGLTAEQKIANFKLAIEGKEVSGAKLNADPSDYKAPWGEALYAKVLAADNSRFSIGKSLGGEKNWGIATNGTPGPTGGVLPAGVETIWLDNTIELCKIGTNYCYNALPPLKVNSGDPDEVAYVPPAAKTAGLTTGTTPLGTGNNITLTVNGATTNANQDLSWNTGYAVYSMGRNDRQTDLLVDAAIFKQIQDMKQCCGQSAAQAPVAMAPVSMYSASASASAPAMPSGNLNVTVKQKRDFLDWANLIFNGAQAVSDVKNAFWGIDINGNRRYYQNGEDFQRYYNGLFQGDNQLGNGSGGNGWGNTWPNTALASGYSNPTIRRGF